jgi:REP element-mobilizing transposase RayT
MSRPLRIEIANGIYHVTTRGLERHDIVRDDRDRRRWTEMLDIAATRHSWRVLAWVLMTNHFHLFLRTPDPNLSAGMHDLNSGYVTWFNTRHNRCGPLFQGRFHAVLVERDYHYWELSRYLHLNPVRAGLAERPEAYPWGSCCHYFAERGAPAWLVWNEVLFGHGTALRQARNDYMRFLMDGLTRRLPNPLDAAVASAVYGAPSFVDKVRSWLEKRMPDREVPATRELARRIEVEEIQQVVCGEFGVQRDSLLRKRNRWNDARSAAIYLCRKLTSRSLADVGAEFGGITQSAVTRTATRVAMQRREDGRFDALIRKCEIALAPGPSHKSRPDPSMTGQS